MRRIPRSLGITVVLALMVAPPAAGQMTVRFGGEEPTANLTASQRTFVDSLLPAIAGRDVDRYARLLHPASLACRNRDNEEVFQDQFARRQGLVAAREPRVTIQKLPAKMQFFEFMAKNGYPTPVRPTHAIHVDLGSVGNADRSLVAFVVFERAAWYEVYACPTAEAVVQYRAKKLRDAEEQSQAKERAESLRDPLRAEIIALLNAGQKIGAIKKYREATGADLAMAKRVVEALQSSTR